MKRTDVFEIHKDIYSNNGATSSSSGRYRWVIDNFLLDVNGKNILEIGCGDGGVIQFLKNNNNVYGVDASESGVLQCIRKGIPAKVYDGSYDILAFEDCYFDYIICLETLEHLENPQHCLEEIKRCLKLSGSVIISVPNPRTGHEFIYPGLFECSNFKKYLKLNFELKKFLVWGYVPIFRKVPNYYLNHGFQYVMRYLFGHQLTYFWAWCWIFEATKVKNNSVAIERVAKNVWK